MPIYPFKDLNPYHKIQLEKGSHTYMNDEVDT